MKVIYFGPFIILLLILVFPFGYSQETYEDILATEYEPIDQSIYDTIVVKEFMRPEFQAIIDSANVRGAILIYDQDEDKYYSNDFEWTKKGQLPASTFKIPNSIIALETGVVANDRTVFRWDGDPRALRNWEQDLTFKEAFHFSCVPCYQEVARHIGLLRMREYLSRFNYGLIKVDSGAIDSFWLQGDSRINQFQQIDFLKRMYQSELPISERTEKIMKGMMVIEQNEHYTLSGKTGWSIRNGVNNGWFVGYVQTKNSLHFFATNVEPKEGFDMEMFPMIRKEITFKALKELKVIQ